MPKKNPRATKSLGPYRREPPPCVVCGKPSARGYQGRFQRTCSEECKVENRRLSGYNGQKARVIGAEFGNTMKYRRRAKLTVLSAYSNGAMKCACCGASYIEFLTIDHIDGGGAKHRRSLGNGNISNGGSALYAWLIKEGFPPGYRVLCQNCNFSIGVFGYCPHDKRTDLFTSPLEIFKGNIKNAKKDRTSCDGLRAQPEPAERG